MKKIYLLPLFASLIALPALAQISVSPNPAVNNDFEFTEIDVVANSTVTNTSGENLTVTWVRNIIEIPEYWSTAVCDITQCYLTFVGQQSFNMAPGMSGNLDVHVYPDGNEGTAVIEVKLSTTINPSDTTYVTFLFNSSLGTTERMVQRIRVYPNPTTDEVRMEAGHPVHRAEVYSLDGKQVKNNIIAGSQVLSLADLPNGTYVLRLRDASGGLLSANVVVRQ